MKDGGDTKGRQVAVENSVQCLGATGHMFYEPREPGAPSAWGCRITPLPSRVVTTSTAL